MAADPPSRRFVTQLAFVVGGAFVLRLIVFLTHQRGEPFGFNDAPYYSGQAVALTRGEWFIDPGTGGPGAEHGPLTALLLAPVSWIDEPADAQRLVTLLAGVACVAVIGFAAYALADGTAHAGLVGLTAAVLAAVYPNLWLNDGIVMSESFATLLVAAWILVALHHHRRRTSGLATLLAVIGALAALARSELVILVVVGFVFVALDAPDDRRRQLGRYAAATVVVIGPWVVPNLVRFEQPVAMTTNDGTTLRGANCDRTYEGRELGSWSVECLVIDPETVGLETSVRSRRWRDDGIAYAIDHADQVPVVVAARVGRTLDLFGLDYQIDEDVRDGRPRLGSVLGIGAFWILAPIAVVGLIRARGRTRQLLLVPVIIVACTTVVFYGGHRIRSPLEPVVVLGAALAITAFIDRWRVTNGDADEQPTSGS